MCATTEYFNGATGKCTPLNSSTMDEKSYDGKTPIWAYFGEILAGGGALAAGLKGTNTAPVTNVYGNPNQNQNPNTLIYIIGGVVLLIVLFVALKK